MRKGRSKAKVQSKVLTKLHGAVSRSKAKTGGVSDDDAEFEANTQAAIARSQAVSDRPPLGLDDIAAPSDEQALEFAKLLRSGVPQPDALAYVLGTVEAGYIDLALPRWMRAKNVVEALATLNGGRWPALEPDARLDIALDKHYAELAHFLYTHDYETAEGRDLGKINAAREALEKLRTGRLEQSSPFVKFLRTLLGKSDSPQLPGQSQALLGAGERPSVMGLVDVVDGEVTETSEGDGTIGGIVRSNEVEWDSRRPR